MTVDGGELQRLVVEGDVGQPHELFRIVAVAVRRLDQLAAEEIVDGREAAGLRMADVAALHRRKPQRGKLGRLVVHADLGIDAARAAGRPAMILRHCSASAGPARSGGNASRAIAVSASCL